MARKFKARHAGSDRPTLYQDITDKIIAELEAGRVPWVQPWASAKAPLQMPHNASSSRCYSGINILILWHAVVSRGFSSNAFLTFRQALELGGNVCKGATGTTVVYAHRFTPGDERRQAAEEGRAAGTIPFLKRFTVFNIDQCEGLPDTYTTEIPQTDPAQILPEAETLIAATGADFRIGGDQAYYDVANDRVCVPPPSRYFDPINWNRTAFHELGHYAVSWIMPHGRGWRLLRFLLATRQFGIIRALRGTRVLVESGKIAFKSPGQRAVSSVGEFLATPPTVAIEIPLQFQGRPICRW